MIDQLEALREDTFHDGDSRYLHKTPRSNVESCANPKKKQGDLLVVAGGHCQVLCSPQIYHLHTRNLLFGPSLEKLVDMGNSTRTTFGDIRSNYIPIASLKTPGALHLGLH